MSFVSKLIGKLTGAQDQADAAVQASQTQGASAQAGIDEERRQFDAMQAALAPYVNAGTGALGGQKDLLGLNGTDAQGAAIHGIESSPMFGALAKQGEDSILANASATGGLRGGNIQGALAQFRPTLLAQLIDQQYGRLGGMTGVGQASAAGVGNAGLKTGDSVAQLLQQQGAAMAGGQLADGNVASQGFVNGGKIAATVASFFGGKGASF